MPKSNPPPRLLIAVLVAATAALLGLWPVEQLAKATVVTGRVVGVHDGDSMTVLAPGNVQMKVRLEGIDAPELGQPFGRAAKRALSDLVFGSEVALHVSGQDRYQRTLAVVHLGRLNVNLEMVRLGFAWRYDAYSDDAVLLAAQMEAKSAGVGLWADRLPVAPWLWRKNGK